MKYHKIREIIVSLCAGMNLSVNKRCLNFYSISNKKLEVKKSLPYTTKDSFILGEDFKV